VTLARRDLFDARFQLISEDARDGVAKKEQDEVKDRIRALEFLDAPSDLVPGVYEGGLKTWECSLDLVDYLDSTNGGDIRGRRVLEV
jgi:protein-histidine N-methyltransferase